MAKARITKKKRNQKRKSPEEGAMLDEPMGETDPADPSDVTVADEGH